MSRNLIGQIFFNQYRVDSFIASGGMGAVYRAWDVKRNVYLALKVLHEDMLDEPSILKRFKREARALEKLSHPNIVPFYGFYQTSNLAFLLEAYIDGPSLKDVIRNRDNQPFPLNQALVYLKAICAALGYAHSFGVVHCDVKPGNVMLDSGGNIFLTDFGIARHAESTTTTFATVGTAAYMAPEQIRGDPVSITTDVYALGVLSFELLTGQRPFQGDEKNLASSGTTAGERLRYAHLSLPPPDPRSINSQLPAELAKLIMQAMAKDQQTRPESAMAFYSRMLQTSGERPDLIADRSTIRLTQISSPIAASTIPDYPIPGQEALSLPASASTKLPVSQKKLGLGIVAVSAVFLMIFLLLMANNFMGRGETANSTTSIVQLVGPPTADGNIIIPVSQNEEAIENILPTNTTLAKTNTPIVNESPTPTPEPSLTPTPTALPGGVWGKIVYTCQIFKSNQKNQICMINADGSNQVRLTTSDTADHAWPSFSPDGLNVIYAANTTGEYEIYEMNLSTRRVTQLTDSLRNSAPEISPDGNMIVYIHKVGEFRQLWVMDRNGQSQHHLVGTDRWGAWDGTWSPDSRKVLFASDMDGEIELFTIDINGGNLKKITSVSKEFSSEQRLRGRSDWSPDGKLMATYLGKSWHWEIYLINQETMKSGFITNGGNNLAPSFSPNGEWITYTSYRDNYGDDNGCELYIISSEGSDIRRLTDNDYCDWQPRWGP